jgi:membrane-associated phospholipid phosphatase
MNFDQRISRNIFETTKRSKIFSRLAVFGAAEFIWILIGFGLGLFWFGAQSVDPGHVPAEWFIMAIVIAVPWAVTLVIEFIVKRQRPFDAETYQPLIHMMWKTPCFPSGHATISFALLAFVVSMDIPQLILWFAIGAAAIAISRIAVGVHYLSDVIVGSLIGYFGGLATLTALQMLILASK